MAKHVREVQCRFYVVLEGIGHVWVDAEQSVHGRRIEHHLPEVRDLSPRLQAFAHNVEPSRRLHPRVRHHNPDRAEMRPQAHHASGQEMNLGANPVPTEQQHRQEARLEKEREDALRRQRAAEHVAYIRVNRRAPER